MCAEMLEMHQKKTFNKEENIEKNKKEKTIAVKKNKWNKGKKAQQKKSIKIQVVQQPPPAIFM